MCFLLAPAYIPLHLPSLFRSLLATGIGLVASGVGVASYSFAVRDWQLHGRADGRAEARVPGGLLAL